MDAFNLDDLSLKELHDLQAQVARAIASFEDRKKNEALSALAVSYTHLTLPTNREV